MDQQRATQFVLRRLDECYSVEETVHALCVQTGWPFKQVASFVRRIEAQNRHRAVDTTFSSPPDGVASTVRTATAMEVNPASEPGGSKRVGQGRADEEMIRFVIGELGQHRSHDQVVRALCEQRGWNWREAERFVRRVEIEQHSKIAARQSSLVVGLSIGSVLAGAGLTIYTVFAALHGNFNEYSPGLLLTGLGMVIGGIVGIWRAASLIRGFE